MKYTEFNDNIHLIVNYIHKNILYIKRKYSNNVFKQKAYYNIHSIKILKCILQQILLKLDLAIRYNDFDLKGSIQEGTSFIFRLESSIYLSFQKLDLINFSYLFKQFINIKYYKAIHLPKIILNTKTYKNIFILSTQIYGPINIANNLIAKLNSSIKFNNVLFNTNHYKILYYFLNFQYLYNLEYHCFFPPCYSFYIFCNYSHQLKYNSFNNRMQSDTSLNYTKAYLKHTMNIGSGIQFKIPIRNIPPLRIEYCINNNAEKSFQLRIYSKYQEYHS